MAVGTTNVSLRAVRTEMSKSLSNVSLARTVQNGYLESGSWVIANGFNQTTASATRGPLDTGSYGTGNSFFNLRRFAGYNHANIRFKFDPQYATASVGGVGNVRETYGPTTGSDPVNFTFNYQSASWTTGQANIISGSMQGFGATGWRRPIYNVSSATSSMGFIDFDGSNDYVWWADAPTGRSYKSYSGSANSSSLGFMFWIRMDGNTGGPIRTVWANNTSPTAATNYGGVRFLISGAGATANRAIMSYGSAQSTTLARFFTSSYFLTNNQWYCVMMNVNGGSSVSSTTLNSMFITPRTSASADLTNRVGNASGSATYLGWVGGSDARMVWGLDRGVGYFNGAIGPFVMRPGPFALTDYQQFFNAWRAATPA